jgi:hypothetical protein
MPDADFLTTDYTGCTDRAGIWVVGFIPDTVDVSPSYDHPGIIKIALGRLRIGSVLSV